MFAGIIINYVSCGKIMLKSLVSLVLTDSCYFDVLEKKIIY